LRRRVYNALLGALMEKFESHSIAEWNDFRDQHLASGKNRLKPADHIPEFIEGSLSAALHSQQWVDAWFTVIPAFRDAGVDETVLQRMIGWAERMWPDGDWDRVRASGLLFIDSFE